MNIVLGGVEETIVTKEVDPETEEVFSKVGPPPFARSRTWRTGTPPTATAQTSSRTFDMLFVRGDVIILISPPLRTA